MDLSAIIAFAVLEVLVVGVLYAAYLHIRNRRKQMRTEGGRAAGILAADQYVSALQDAILKADARLAGLNESDSDASDQRRLIETRLAFLRAERKAVDQAGQDEGRFWDMLAEELAPLLPGDGAADDADSTLVESLRLQIHAYEKRLANLERFRELFFEMKGKLAENNMHNEQLQAEVCRAVPVEEQSPELKNLLEELEQKNRQMSAQLQNVEDAFTEILRHASEPIEAGSESLAGTMSGIDRSVESIRKVISTQEKRIAELAAVIAEKEIELSDREELERSLKAMGENNRELEAAITAVEEENQFLQEQISMLLTQELEKNREEAEEKEALRKQQEEQLVAYAELADKFAAMEKEYLQMYEENQRMQVDGEPGTP